MASRTGWAWRLGSACLRTLFPIALCASAAHAEGDGQLPFHMSGYVDFDSSYVSKGRTCHDAPVLNPNVAVHGFRIGETVLPFYAGCWSVLSLSSTDKYPLEKPGRWVEVDPYAGAELAGLCGLGECLSMKAWVLRWHFPATHRQPMDMAAFDTRANVFLHPSTSWRYRYHGKSEGRVEIKVGIDETRRFTDDWNVFGSVNLWLVDYRNESSAKESGLNSGDLTAGLGWKMFCVKAVYWFPLDRRVLNDRPETYGYDKRLVLATGVRFSF